MTDAQIEFQRIYSHLFDCTYRYTLFRIPHREDAENIVAITLHAAYRSLHRYDEHRDNLEQFVLGIAKHKIIDYYRSHKMLVSLDEALHYAQDNDTSIEMHVDNQLGYEELITHLPQQVQMVFALHYIDNFTYAEIAQIVDKKPATVRKLFSNILKRLRYLLTDTTL